MTRGDVLGAARPPAAAGSRRRLRTATPGMPNDSASLTKSGLPKSDAEVAPELLVLLPQRSSRTAPFSQITLTTAVFRRAAVSSSWAVHQKAAVAADRDDVASRVHELGADRRRQREAHPGQAVGDQDRAGLVGGEHPRRSTACAAPRRRPGCRCGRAPDGGPTARAAGASGSGRHRAALVQRPHHHLVQPARASGRSGCACRPRPAARARARCRRSARRRG